MRYTLREKLVCGIATFNFLTFLTVDLWLGGDALNGKVSNGHYMLGSHGTFTEVSEGIFVYSYIHTVSMFLTMGLAAWMSRRAQARHRSELST